MRLLIAISLGAALAATAAAAQISNGIVTYSSGSSSCGCEGTGQSGFVNPGQTTGLGYVPTRYEASLAVLRAQMAHTAQRDGGHLTAKHQAEFQQALDETNRHFRKGPYAPQ